MPVHVKKIHGKYRIVDDKGDIETTSRGHARDGGGHRSKAEADKQARAMNASHFNPDWREEYPKKSRKSRSARGNGSARKGGDRPGEGKYPYGSPSEAHYADPGYQEDGKERYPLDTEEHIRAAHSYFGKPKNRDRYTPEQQKKIEGRIRRAWKKEIDAAGPPDEREDGEKGKASIPHPTSY